MNQENNNYVGRSPDSRRSMQSEDIILTYSWLRKREPFITLDSLPPRVDDLNFCVRGTLTASSERSRFIHEITD